MTATPQRETMVVLLEEYRANAIAEAAILGAMRRLGRAQDRVPREDWRKRREIDRTIDALHETAISLRLEREQWTV